MRGRGRVGRDGSAGRTTAGAGSKEGDRAAPDGIGSIATSPGSTRTDTPRSATATRIAVSSTPGICSGVDTISQ